MKVITVNIVRLYYGSIWTVDKCKFHYIYREVNNVYKMTPSKLADSFLTRFSEKRFCLKCGNRGIAMV